MNATKPEAVLLTEILADIAKNDARYRWLRGRTNAQAVGDPMLVMHNCDSWADAESMLDAAIDAARLNATDPQMTPASAQNAGTVKQKQDLA